MSKLVLEQVTKTFGEFYAAREISFCAEEGEFVTLLGPSGCGKTTLLKMIGGFHQPDSGRILIGDKTVNALPPEKRNTAMCFQSYALFPHLNVAHNICFGLKQKKVAISEQQDRLTEALKQVGLESQRLKMPAQLSGGQQQRVALARAMITRPDVIRSTNLSPTLMPSCAKACVLKSRNSSGSISSPRSTSHTTRRKRWRCRIKLWC